jgi:hypothetical protein
MRATDAKKTGQMKPLNLQPVLILGGVVTRFSKIYIMHSLNVTD